MQREKTEAEEAARNMSDPTNPSPKSPNDSAKKPSVPKEETNATAEERKKPRATSPSHHKHQKSKSDATREATFASLQRALNAAVAWRDQNPRDGNGSDASVSPSTAVPPKTAGDPNEQAIFDQPFSGLDAKHAPIPWSPQTPQDAFGYGSLNATAFSANDSLHGHALNDTHHIMPTQNIQFDELLNQGQAPQSFPGHRAASDAGASYNMEYVSLQPPETLSRRESSDELANTVQGVGIRSGSSHKLQPNRPDRLSVTPKETGKELDIAARRKRPRPAAIGTPGSGRLAGSAMSPTTRAPANAGVRQSKSAQSLNSRYAGVRKASAAQRSPLNLTTFAEAELNSKADVSSVRQPSVSTSSLAPPTPLTPEDLHHLLPTSPASGYCLSAHPSNQFLPATQPMPLNVTSPPATPLPMDVISQFPYANVAPPMSAPAQYTTFPDFGSCEGVPLTARSWADSATVPSPEMVFQDTLPMPQVDMSTIPYDSSIEPGQSTSHEVPLMYPAKSDMSGGAKPADFQIHEFPGQHEAHRYVAQQVPSHKRKNYIFTNKTPMAFDSQ